MSRLHARLFRLNDEIDRLREEERLTAAELEILAHLDDDAQRDAAVGGPLERDEARATASDVARFRKNLAVVNSRRRHLERKRERLLKRLG